MRLFLLFIWTFWESTSTRTCLALKYNSNQVSRPLSEAYGRRPFIYKLYGSSFKVVEACLNRFVSLHANGTQHQIARKAMQAWHVRLTQIFLCPSGKGRVYF